MDIDDRKFKSQVLYLKIAEPLKNSHKKENFIKCNDIWLIFSPFFPLLPGKYNTFQLRAANNDLQAATFYYRHLLYLFR